MTLSKKMTFCKIVATLGTNSDADIKKLFKAGVNVFRLNLSHSSPSDCLPKIRLIRMLEKEYSRPVGIFMDLQGPKLRVGKFENGSVVLKDGQNFILDLNKSLGNDKRVNLPHPEIYAAVKKGSRLLFNDGLISASVLSVSKREIKVKIINGGVLSDHKGVNVPDVSLDISSLTAQDRAHIKEANNMDIDWFALSFVQKPEDIILARKLIAPEIGIISKIEKPQALDHLDKIVELSDAVMVARGDLGVEMSPERVPLIQRHIIDISRSYARPVIVATQMLESMILNPRPTRAEASDVATAVYEGTDAVMLSAETATGKYPVEAVETMVRIITTIEAEPAFKTQMRVGALSMSAENTASAISKAAGGVANSMETADIIVNFTATGITTLRTASYRPCVAILSLTPFVKTARKMTIVCGAYPKVTPKDLTKFEDIEKETYQVIKKEKLASKGMQVVITAGIPFGHAGDTNLLYILTLK